jgi:tripartite-type tricarboxylate transporter receptor subunit TctC
MRIRRALFVVLLVAGVVFQASQAAASDQVFPVKPIRFIVPYAPGGPNDIFARLFGQRLSRTLGQPVVIDNRPGAGSSIGTSLLARSAADGYTLILSDIPHTINPSVLEKVPYDPLRDFTPIMLIGRAPMWLFVNSSQPVRTATEFVALAKARPKEITVASGGTGTHAHMIIELLQRAAQIEVTHVPFNGAGPSVAAAAAGQVNASITSMPPARPFVQSGRLRPVAVSLVNRHPDYPDVPTFQESGISNMVLQHWWGVLAPAGLPRTIQMKLHQQLVDAINDPTIRERYSALLVEPVTSSPEEFRALIEADLHRWRKLVSEAGIRTQ